MATLCYGDYLDVLKRCLKEKSAGVVYLDPPFNSAQNHNIFDKEKDGLAAAPDAAFTQAPESRKRRGEQKALEL